MGCDLWRRGFGNIGVDGRLSRAPRAIARNELRSGADICDCFADQLAGLGLWSVGRRALRRRTLPRRLFSAVAANTTLTAVSATAVAAAAQSSAGILPAPAAAAADGRHDRLLQQPKHRPLRFRECDLPPRRTVRRWRTGVVVRHVHFGIRCYRLRIPTGQQLRRLSQRIDIHRVHCAVYGPSTSGPGVL